MISLKEAKKAKRKLQLRTKKRWVSHTIWKGKMKYLVFKLATMLSLILNLPSCDKNAVPTIPEVADSYCAMYSECLQTEFEEAYDSLDSCINEFTAKLEEDQESWEQTEAAECWDERLRLMDCAIGANCEQFQADDETICPAELDKYDNCLDRTLNP